MAEDIERNSTVDAVGSSILGTDAYPNPNAQLKVDFECFQDDTLTVNLFVDIPNTLIVKFQLCQEMNLAWILMSKFSLYTE